MIVPTPIFTSALNRATHIRLSRSGASLAAALSVFLGGIENPELTDWPATPDEGELQPYLLYRRSRRTQSWQPDPDKMATTISGSITFNQVVNGETIYAPKHHG